MSAVALLAMTFAASAQQSFNAPEAAAEALVKAVRGDDVKGARALLGRGGDDILSSGDEIADAALRKRFVAAYDAQHKVTTSGDKATLIVGQEDFPFPIPLFRKGERWQFDTAAGRQEILFRRIGRNELDAIQVCLAYVDAQNEYADKDRTGSGRGVYAQRVVSRPGQKDGLYWASSQGGDASPLGELAARAAAEGYLIDGGPAPFHGYYYKILTRQGPAAAGGTLNYVVGGKMIGGFALLAYPAEYGNSGVMTFMINHAGTVYQKDLGLQTADRAKRIASFDPDSSWKKVSPAEQAP
ncbi:DUF2950 domain-containing protein [Bosea caraganae]|nr:DUF2950 domain-containing protein [Bosea caraganae]